MGNGTIGEEVGAGVPRLRHRVHAQLQPDQVAGRARHHPAVEHRRPALGRLQR